MHYTEAHTFLELLNAGVPYASHLKWKLTQIQENKPLLAMLLPEFVKNELG